MKIQQIKPYNISSKGGLKNFYPKLSRAITPVRDCYISSKQATKPEKTNLLEKVFILPIVILLNKLLEGDASKNSQIYDLQQKIESGNGKTEPNAFTPLDINDPIFNDAEKCSEYLVKKIEKQAGVFTEEDIKNSVNKLSQKYGIPEQEVIDIMARLTQFGSYRQLEALGEKIKDLNAFGFFSSHKIGLNRVFRYIHGQKKQMLLSPKPDSKTVFVLDDYEIEHLKNLSFESTKNLYKNNFLSGSLIPVILDGTNIKVNGKKYSYTAFEGGVNLEALTEAVIMQKKEGKSDEEIFNGDYKENFEAIFGKEVADKIVNISVKKEKNTIKTILNQINPILPDKETIMSVIKVNSELDFLPEDRIDEIKSIMLKYFDNILKIYSPDRMAEILKLRHKQIEEYAKSIGRNSSDIYYIIPKGDKSHNIINYTYSKVNHIAPSKFINLDELTGMPENSIAVVIDDVIGSGDSMLDDSFPYYNFIHSYPKTAVIFSTINATKQGCEAINKDIAGNKRENDKIIIDDINLSDIAKFKSKLSQNEFNLLSYALGYLGHIGNGLCTAFPYMIPDNCSVLASYILDFCLLRSNSSSNRAMPEKDVLEKIRLEVINKKF